MQSTAKTPQEYIDSLPEERKEVIENIRKVILNALPEGFQEVICYGMLGYVVPHSIYPKGYHCDPKLPLAFMNLASQKNYIALHHMGIYASPKLLDWFVTEFPKHSKSKLDMGKGCIRFKKMNDIPYDLISELTAKITVQQWIDCYENAFKR
ncbi:DUF1801 domain-containing protein [Flavobacterium sp.]|uniref:DUF1801 domain-containing protein n=1 Tax=Flavobacterium sp. TaxID=239 RepID=UPI00286A5160|nr:DUF1801 domain-containing protein [Flavobacterium sp.]